MRSMPEVLAATGLLVVSLMLGLWGISVVLQDVSLVDIGWGVGFVLIVWCTWLLTAGEVVSDQPVPSRWVLPVLTTLWGLRLASYLAWRNIGQPEDKRYAQLRSTMNPGFWWKSLVVVFGLQGAIMWLVSQPLQWGVAHAQPGWRLGHLIGIALWTLGILFETLGDWQLARFKRVPENAGRVLKQGLWRYTRHPNYFGDFCVWWGLYLVSVAHGGHLWTIVGPMVMSILLMRVSGVTLLERSSMAEKPEFADYAARTNAFFPWPPRSPQ